MPLSVNRHAVELGVLVGVGNLLIYQHFMPPVTDVKMGEQYEQNAESSERTALLVAIGFSALAATFVKSWDTFLVAGVVIIGVDFAYKHAIAVHPATGTMTTPGEQIGSDNDNVHPLPDYADVAQ
jgi:hypothetical protein